MFLLLLLRGFCCHCQVKPYTDVGVAKIISIHFIFPFSTISDILADVEGSEVCSASSDR